MLIDEREEIAREKEDLGFEFERVNAELNLLRNQFERSDAGKLTNQVAQLTEESKELKNDFIIKMSSFTQEIDTLRSKLASYEEADSQDMASKNDDGVSISAVGNGTSQVAAADLARNPAILETSREYRAKYNLEETIDASQDAGAAAQSRDGADASPGGLGAFVASLFLTDSEMKGKGGRD